MDTFLFLDKVRKIRDSTLQFFFPSHPPYNSNYITDTQGLRSPSVLGFLSREPFLFSSQKGGNEKADHPDHIGLGISLIVTKEI
eukprot:COSAG01_NODE_17041_length_1183_cov_0.761993_1_plen_83_part_10